MIVFLLIILLVLIKFVSFCVAAFAYPGRIQSDFFNVETLNNMRFWL